MLEMEIRRADVVCVVYAVDDEDTLDSVADHWLPFVRRTLGEGHGTPVILVGNKVTIHMVGPKSYRYAENTTFKSHHHAGRPG